MDERTKQQIEEKRHTEILEAFQELMAALPKNDDKVSNLISTFVKKLDEFTAPKVPEVNVQVEKVSNEEVVSAVSTLNNTMNQVLQELRTKQEFVVQLNKNGYGVTTSAIFKQV